MFFPIPQLNNDAAYEPPEPPAEADCDICNYEYPQESLECCEDGLYRCPECLQKYEQVLAEESEGE